MPPPPHQKPENVLKRAHELIGVGQAPAALTLLHEHITSKRSRNVPIASLEPVMLLLVELSVEQKKGKLTKDAMYQYKNIAQNSNIGTIELVLKKFLELAADKVTAAQAKADEVQSSIEATTGEAGVDDLEATETPESILLATVSGEQSKDRTDRAIVTPWLKFLWEAYRTVLDILRNNARLEILYQSTAMQAFDFCLKYTRKTEFRRLCELLRNHVQTAAKYSQQMHAINLNDPDTLQRHLETRFQQLNVAVELELWQEAFRSVEDIHTLLNLSKRPPKNIMMANYYEKLTRIFLVGENYLFHAAAWSRYYQLLRQSATSVATGQSKKSDNPAATEADLQKAASFVLLSALSIPVISTTRSRGAMVDFDEARKNKNSRLTHLLGMNSAPTRAVLFQDIRAKQLIRRVRPEIRDLYNILEVDFHPLSICEKISPILAQIGADPDMQKYVLPLQQVILTRLFQQLSQVYETVDLSYVEGLAKFPEPFQVTRATIEKFIMNGNKKGDLAIRMDHATGVLSFDKDIFSSAKAASAGGAGSAEAETGVGSVQRLQSTPAEIVRTQLTRLFKTLHTTCYYIDPTFNEDRSKARQAALDRAKAGAEQEHREILARKEVIQKRKEQASEIRARIERENANAKRLREQQLQEAEAQRLQQELKEREQRRLQKEREEIHKIEIENTIKELKIGTKQLGIDPDDLANLDSSRLRAIKLAQLEREKNDVNEKLRITGKRIDHLERAFRKEEAKKLGEDYEKQRAQDVAAYEKTKQETLIEAKRKHAEAVELKHRVERLVPFYEKFKENLYERRRDEFDKKRREADREMEKAVAARKKEFRDRKIREKREREEKERALREAEEKAAREKEEREQREAQRREEMARIKAQRDSERQEALEKAALQARREEEALARRQREKEQARTIPVRSAAPLERTDSAERPSAGPPRLALSGAGGKPSWRERQAAKEAAGGEAPSDAPPARATPPPVERAAPAERVERVERAERAPPVERTDSNERSSGPPRLNLAGRGGKPASSWRDREAAKRESGFDAPAGDSERTERSAPPARQGSGRGENGRDAAPTETLTASRAPGKWVPRHLRDQAGQ
ncbi:eukaryotic translation initiation factor 3 subunit a [Diaporthe amygdali]|uniref:eukaryotic translation initiation factor 3 subunit a n=1 Tax=Phomopsis amygdali TaxID=1214568 RepID=UPI0022FEA39E|nr:eukaryotic translation initiation factor 3 subunit a [Diaporthe amygdali]KAJ0108588.1 eukaryotic translation initiation factor 3 subunit a [Diaporthe amygdali]